MTDPYCARTTKWPLSGRGLGHVTKFRNFGTPYNFGMNRDTCICFKFGTNVDDGPLLRPDDKTTPKWAWSGSCDQISKFWDPSYNFGSNTDMCFKFGIEIDDGPLLHPDDKMTPKWAWPGSRDQISKFWDPSYNFGTNRDICFKFGTDIDDGPLLRPDHKMTPKWAWPGSRHRILHSKDELLTTQLMLHQRQIICLLTRTKQQI